MPWEMAAVRTLFIIIVISATYHLRPFQLGALNSILLGAVLGLTFVFFEMRLERASLKRLIGAAVGSTLGILAALMMSHLLSVTSVDKGLLSFIQVTLLLLMAYVGLVLGATKGDLLNLSALGGLFTALLLHSWTASGVTAGITLIAVVAWLWPEAELGQTAEFEHERA